MFAKYSESMLFHKKKPLKFDELTKQLGKSTLWPRFCTFCLKLLPGEGLLKFQSWRKTALVTRPGAKGNDGKLVAAKITWEYLAKFYRLFYWLQSILRQSEPVIVRAHISGVTKCVTNFLTLSQWGDFDSVKNFVTHFVTPEIWILAW